MPVESPTPDEQQQEQQQQPFLHMRHTCAGIGWVTFDQQIAASSKARVNFDDDPTTTPEFDIPYLRCVGFRTSQQLQQGHAGQPPLSAYRHRGQPSEAAATVRLPGKSDSPSQSSTSSTSSVSTRSSLGRVEETWAVGCLGRLSMIAPSATGSIASLIAAAAAEQAGIPSSRPLQQQPSLAGPAAAVAAACQVRCSGVTIRLDASLTDASTASPGINAAAASANAAAGPPAATDVSMSHPQPEPPLADQLDPESPARFPIPVLPTDMDGFANESYKGAQAVFGRACHLVDLMKGGFVREMSRPASFVSSTADMSGRICQQAGRIVSRSAEQVSNVVNWPFRDDGDDAEPDLE